MPATSTPNNSTNQLPSGDGRQAASLLNIWRRLGSYHTDLRPLILLDVDGVINDLQALQGRRRRWLIRRLRSHGYTLCIPEYMPALIHHLASVGELIWCTTWRDRANDELVTFLGIGRLAVVDDGTGRRDTGWKAGAAREIAAKALAEGRRVIWIEDFYGEAPRDQMPEGVEFIDTGDEQVLRPGHLPADLRPSPSQLAA